MNIKFTTLPIMTPLLLTGCDYAKNSVNSQLERSSIEVGNSPTIIISPGWKINDNGSIAEVYGNKSCPTLSKDDFRTGCIILTTEVKTVEVYISHPNSSRKEIWIVERQGKFPNDNVRFKRPDGTYVISMDAGIGS